MKLRVGLIGLGDFWHNRHAPALRMLSDRFELRAVCDQVVIRASGGGRVWGHGGRRLPCAYAARRR